MDFPVSKAMDPRSNPLHGSNGGELLAANLRQIPVEHIQPDAQQPRQQVITQGPEWEGLVDSVRKHGVLQPILVHRHPSERDRYIIICGERRWRAACEVALSHITARIIKSDAMLAHKQEHQLLENALRQGLSPLDEMEACVRLARDQRLTQLAIGRLLGVGRSVVADIFKLDRITAAVRDQIRRCGGSFSRRQLLRIAVHEGADAQERVWQQVVGQLEPTSSRPKTVPAPTTQGDEARDHDQILQAPIHGLDQRHLAALLRRVANYLETHIPAPSANAVYASNDIRHAG